MHAFFMAILTYLALEGGPAVTEAIFRQDLDSRC